MLCLRDPIIRTSMIAMFLIGVATAAARPYQSLIAIEQFGMSNANFSILLFAASMLGVAYALVLGNLSDLLQDRKRIILLTTTAGIIGFGVIYLFPKPLIFIVSTLFIIPILSSQFSVLFGAVRAQTNTFAEGDAAAVNSLVRSVFALSWIMTPGLVALMLAKSDQLTLAYLISCLVCMIAFVLVWATFGSKAQANLENNGSKPKFLAAMSALLDWRIALSIFAIALILGSQHLNTVIMPLIITKAAGGKITDVGFIVGAIAAFEVPFMLAFGSAMRRYSAGQVLIFGTLIYAIYLSLLGVATQPWHLYALVPISSAGAAAILSIPMTYLQNLLPNQPGLGSALLTIAAAIGGTASAGVFALGTYAFAGYSQTAFMGAGMAILGALFLTLIKNAKSGQ
jgi:predicted MFS family arabinose efflux permease